MADRYLARRYDEAFPLSVKLLLLMLETEMNGLDLVVPLSESRHPGPVFRARVVTLFHVLRTLDAVLTAHGDAKGPGTEGVRALLASAEARQVIGDSGMSKVRNRCVHYEIREKVDLAPDRPMYGLVEALYPGSDFGALDATTRSLTSKTAEVLSRWSS